ncbi:MAG: HD domain-containing protein [Lachnospiraceae bacterium]|nr:HD domain-containing protein [Lachnospiraceae bacterium]
MRFVEINDLKQGERIVRPIYNTDGVLLYGSGTKTDASVVAQLKRLDLFGLYVLDEQEPVPEISQEVLDMEAFQTKEAHVIDEICRNLIAGKPINGLEETVDLIIRRFGFLKEPMHFNQSLRSKRDFVSKHTLNVAILTSMIAGKLNLEMKERSYLVEAAFFYDIGKYLAPEGSLFKSGALTEEELQEMRAARQKGYALLKDNYAYPAGVRRYLIQLSKDMMNHTGAEWEHEEQNLLPGTRILKVADIYDVLTAVRPYKAPKSPFSAYKIMIENPDEYELKYVEALAESLHILPVGSYVQLTNGEQGIVIRENDKTLERPIVLGFASNKMYDLSQAPVFREVKIIDTVSTPDNRPQIKVDVGAVGG